MQLEKNIPKCTEDDVKALSRLCRDVFNDMAGIYGNKWLNVVNSSESVFTSTRKIWLNNLVDYDQNEVDRALQDMQRNTKFDEWPPTATQFLRLLQAARKRIKEEQGYKSWLPETEVVEFTPQSEENRIKLNELLDKIKQKKDW